MKVTLGALFPPQCPACGDTVADQGGLCPACWRETEFISGCCCDLCGAPVPGGGELDNDIAHCEDCLTILRPWTQGRAAVTYAGTARQLAMAFKHGDRVDLAPSLGRWVARAAEPLVTPDMLVVPVPIHPLRMVKRKYNQAALLAGHVAQAHALRLVPGALVRKRHTPMQDHGSVGDRFANVEAAIEVPARMKATIADRPALIVDDVMASGATLAACASALLEAGSGPVSVAVLARAVKDGGRFAA